MIKLISEDIFQPNKKINASFSVKASTSEKSCVFTMAHLILFNTVHGPM